MSRACLFDNTFFDVQCLSHDSLRTFDSLVTNRHKKRLASGALYWTWFIQETRCSESNGVYVKQAHYSRQQGTASETSSDCEDSRQMNAHVEATPLWAYLTKSNAKTTSLLDLFSTISSYQMYGFTGYWEMTIHLVVRGAYVWNLDFTLTAKLRNLDPLAFFSCFHTRKQSMI